MDQGFLDLRQNHGESGLGESFWPSFTDIMTVVVMIFIITSTVLIVRNWELLAELRSTLEAERQAEAQVAATERTNRDLEERIARLEHALAEVQIRNVRLTEENRVQRTTLGQREQQLLALRRERDRLVGELEGSRQEAARRGELLAERENSLARLDAEHRQQAARLDETLASLASLEAQHQAKLAQLDALGRERASLAERVTRLEAAYSARLAELEESRRARAALSEEMTTLQAEYTTLDEKYQKLIRPARTASGKQVVEVRYLRSGGLPLIQLRAPGEEGFAALGTETMHQRLAALKGRYGDDLYVKVIIPADSGLSYNEAWDFTRTVLNRYDYYYQE